MKRTFLTIWILLLSCSSLIQGEGSGKYGIKIGAGFSTASFIDSDNLLFRNEFKSRVGPNFGVTAHLYRKKNLSFYGELEYQARGSKEEIRIVVSPGNIPTDQIVVQDNLFEYLSFSSGIQFTFTNWKVSPFMNSGISLNLLLREDCGFGDLNFNTNRFVVGWEVGGGLAFAKLPQGELFVEIKYDVDLTKALENEDNLPIDLSMKHQLLSVSLGIRLQ